MTRVTATAHDVCHGTGVAPFGRLTRTTDKLQATQILVAESARTSERLQMSRDLHDVLGHSLTTLAVHLDVASRPVQSPTGALPNVGGPP